MSLHVGLAHRTVYRYDRPVTLSPQVIRLRPAPHTRSGILSYALKVEPKDHFLNWQQDPHGNWLARAVFPEKVAELRIAVDLVAEFVPYNPFDFFLAAEAGEWPFDYEPVLAKSLEPFRGVETPAPRFEALLEAIPRQRTNTVGFLMDLNRDLQARIRYVVRHEPGVQGVEETLERGSGSCRDSAWLMVQALRHLGFAARFVSGYLVQLRPDVRSRGGAPGPQADELHAWAEVYLPGAGWIGLDPTSGLLTSEGHIPLCATPEPESAAPVSGAHEPCAVEFSHELKATRLPEAGRPARAAPEAQWQAADRAGLAERQVAPRDAQRDPREAPAHGVSREVLAERTRPLAIDWTRYKSDSWDELFEAPGKPRPAARRLTEYLGSLDAQEMAERRLAAELAIKVMGISFTVYSEGQNVDRSWPFDIIPRVIPWAEWQRTERGLKQRVRALNAFIQDLYGEQKVLRDGVFPRELLADSVNYREQCRGATPRGGVWAHVCGSDLVRGRDGALHVLEDNLRVPSGVSYMMENRKVIKRVFPELFETSAIRPVDDYPAQLYDTLAGLSPRPGSRPTVVLLTPGIYNSAYFEHCYLAQQMGVELVEGTDLFVGADDVCYMRTLEGPRRVDVIYRRIDDLFLDPEAFRPDSALGVRGLMRAWLRGTVALANAPGAGVADDKVVYTFVPKLIRYYLGEDAILPNVESFLCHDDKQRRHVLANLEKLVVKPANESGGYGMLMGPRSTKKERDKFRELIKADPRNYMAQPALALSTAPTLVEGGIAPRHLDLRPFILSRDEPYVTMGGLTRVALKKGSLVVNSSQGGGSKDTWIVDTEEPG
jgi:uncharacterized circularly permuted ATP-grasp superfamily protein/transglutaminase-like putative cysteine protease